MHQPPPRVGCLPPVPVPAQPAPLSPSSAGRLQLKPERSSKSDQLGCAKHSAFFQHLISPLPVKNQGFQGGQAGPTAHSQEAMPSSKALSIGWFKGHTNSAVCKTQEKPRSLLHPGPPQLRKTQQDADGSRQRQQLSPEHRARPEAKPTRLLSSKCT